MSDKFEDTFQTLCGVLDEHVAPLFQPGVRLTIIVRDPLNDERDVLVSSDTIDSLIALLERSRSRPIVTSTPQ